MFNSTFIFNFFYLFYKAVKNSPFQWRNNMKQKCLKQRNLFCTQPCRILHKEEVHYAVDTVLFIKWNLVG